MSDNRADEYVKQAEKKMSSSGGLFSKVFRDTSAMQEEAIELYEKAAGQYKINKQWQEAGDVLFKAAELAEKMRNGPDAPGLYMNAGKAYLNSSNRDALKAFHIAVRLYMDNNRFGTAGRLYKDIAAIEEKELHPKEAMEAWEKAAQCFETDNANAHAGPCLLSVARLAADEGDYKKAIDIFEKVATSALDNNSGAKWSVSEYLFKAALCCFVVDATCGGEIEPTRRALEKYIDLHPAFENSREYSALLNPCVNAFEKNDPGAFLEAIRKYDLITKLDTWTAKLFLRVKEALEEGPAAMPGDEGVHGGATFDNKQDEALDDLA